MHSPALQETPPTVGRRAIDLIFAIMLLDIIELTIIFPVAPFLVQRYGGDALMVTALTGIYAAWQFLATPALGAISDRVGRRRVLLACLFGSAVGYVLFGIGGALWVLLFARAIDGVTGGNISTCMAYLADVSTPEERPRNFSLIGIAYGLGFILGPALGGTLGEINLNLPAFTAAGLTSVSLVLVARLLPESLPPERRERQPLTGESLNPLAAIGAMAMRPGLGTLLAAGALFAFAFNAVNSVLSLYVAETFGVAVWQIGMLLVVSGIVTVVTQAALAPRVVVWLSERTMAGASQLGLAAGALVIVLAPAFWWLYPNTLLMNGVGGFFWATVGALLAARVPPQSQGQLAGANTALHGLMAVLGPPAAGLAYKQVGPGAPFWIAAGLFLLAAALLARRLQPVAEGALQVDG